MNEFWKYKIRFDLTRDCVWRHFLNNGIKRRLLILNNRSWIGGLEYEAENNVCAPLTSLCSNENCLIFLKNLRIVPNLLKWSQRGRRRRALPWSKSNVCVCTIRFSLFVVYWDSYSTNYTTQTMRESEMSLFKYYAIYLISHWKWWIVDRYWFIRGIL